MGECERTQAHLDGKRTPEQLKMSKNVISSQLLFFFSTPDSLFPGSSECAELLFCPTSPDMWPLIIALIDPSIDTTAVDGQWTSVSMPRVAHSTDRAISSLALAIALRYL